MRSSILQFVIFNVFFLSFSNGNDQDETNVFFFNTRNKCALDNYFDIDFFKCRLCDPNFNLKASQDKDRCVCDKNSTEVFEYDNIHKRPICEKPMRVTNQPLCKLHYVNATTFSSIRKSVKIHRRFQNESCACDEKSNELYEDFCIGNELFKGINLPYKNSPLTQSLNLSRDLRFIVFFCQVLHQRKFCNFLANICVLTHYDLSDKGPCHPFYTQQINQNELSMSSVLSEGSVFDGGEKLKPFLFFSNGKSAKTLFKQPIDFSYDLRSESVNSTINFTLVSYGLRGDVLKTRQMELSDLNLCNLYSSPSNLWQEKIKLAKNLISKCTINLREIVNLRPDTSFHSIFLNYYENGANFLQTVPVAIRDAFEVNKLDDVEKWQFVKRFFLIDTVSGRLFSTNGKTEDLDDDFRQKFHEKFNQIKYVRSVELRFYINEDDNSDTSNKIKIPLLVLDYGTLNLTSIKSDESEPYNVDFTFKVTFIKRPNLNNFFQIVLPILSTFAFLFACLQTFFFKMRQQKRDYDCATFTNFVLNLLGNLANALFLFVLLFVCYVYVSYKSQSTVIKILLPLKSEEKFIEIVLLVALLFKIVKLSSIFNEIFDVDIFFIDFERPKYTSDNFAHGLNKSNPGTPSISSSLKPSLSPNNDCVVSCWRNYFIANEWQELITKRKISIHLHVVYVIGALLVFGFENYASLEFNLHLNQTHQQSYLSHLKITSTSAEMDNRILLVAVGAIAYLSIYLLQRLYNFMIYERFIDNCLQQFIDVASIANISVLILLDSFGYYVHGRSVHGRSDIDTFNMILQFKREEENLVGHRGLLPGGDHQTYTILAPRNLRLFYEKLISPINSKTSRNQSQFSNQSVKFNFGFEKMILTYHNINRFFAAFIDHALKDVDYVVKEKNLFEKLFDCEIYTSTSDAKGVFYFDNGHSFDKVLFYGNENAIFGFEFLLFVFLLFTTGNILIASLSIGIVFKLVEIIMNHLTKNNLARKTLIDKRFLI